MIVLHQNPHILKSLQMFFMFFCLQWCRYLPPISSGVAVRLYCWSLLLLARRFSLQRFPQLFAAQVAHCLRCTWGAILKLATDLEVGLWRCEIPTLKHLYIIYCIQNSRNLKKHDEIIKLKEHWHTNSQTCVPYECWFLCFSFIPSKHHTLRVAMVVIQIKVNF